MLLSDAKAVYAGTVPAKAVYVGSQKVWPQLPASIAGLVTWLDAKDYTPGNWPNKGPGPAVHIVGTPVMTAGAPQNGHPTVRFKTSEGRVRGDWPYPIDDWTVLYVMRWVGPGVGRAWTVCYPPSNLLIGTHTTGQDTAYFNGAWLGPNGGGSVPWGTAPGPWKIYEGDSDSTSVTVGFYLNGTAYGRYGAGSNLGLTNGWGMSGYDTVGAQETMDIEVGEILIYSRRLSDGKRQQLETYLQNKWGIAGPVVWDSATTAYMSATGLDVSYKPIIDKLVTDLKAAGLWTKMQAIYPFVGGTAALHKWNLKDPQDTDAAFRLTFLDPAFHSSHSTALGYRANSQGAGIGSGSYADTHLQPSLHLTDVNSTHLSFYSLQDVPSADRAEMGCYNWNGSGSRFHIIARYQGVDSFYYGMSEEGANHYVVPGASGLFVATRTSASAQRGYRNGIPGPADSAAPANGLPNRSVFIGAINEFANRSDIPCGFASIGAGLDDRENSDLYNIVQAYQTALNRQV